MTITLIGMPGCGKSCMGRAISSKLKMKNIDTDKYIEQKTGKLLHQIIEEVGVDEFKRIEEENLLTINLDNVILSTGGSAVYYDKVMKHYKTLGPVVYLYVSIDVLIERLGDFSKRGIVMKPGQTIHDLFEERTALYEKYADITVNCDGKAYRKYQQDLIKAIKEYENK
jgi:shikimate kinase